MKNYTLGINKDNSLLLKIELLQKSASDKVQVVIVSHTQSAEDLYLIHDCFSRYVEVSYWNEDTILSLVKDFIKKDRFDDIEQKFTYICDSEHYDSIMLVISNLFNSLLKDLNSLGDNITLVLLK